MGTVQTIHAIIPMAGRISLALRKSIVGTLRFLIITWVISVLLMVSAYVIVTQIITVGSIPWNGRGALSLAIGIIALGTTIKIHWPIWSAEKETESQNSRISLTVKKCIVVTVRMLLTAWVIALLLRVPAGIIVAKDFTITSMPWIGEIPLDVAIGIVALALTVKLQWPIWPTDEETKSFFSFGSSRSSTRSTGKSNGTPSRTAHGGGTGGDVGYLEYQCEQCGTVLDDWKINEMGARYTCGECGYPLDNQRAAREKVDEGWAWDEEEDLA
jgi:predicted RNA-binding Zn-ribbon protein involved in translation (DUF1610 family)